MNDVLTIQVSAVLLISPYGGCCTLLTTDSSFPSRNHQYGGKGRTVPCDQIRSGWCGTVGGDSILRNDQNGCQNIPGSTAELVGAKTYHRLLDSNRAPKSLRKPYQCRQRRYPLICGGASHMHDLSSTASASLAYTKPITVIHKYDTSMANNTSNRRYGISK